MVHFVQIDGMCLGALCSSVMIARGGTCAALLAIGCSFSIGPAKPEDPSPVQSAAPPQESKSDQSARLAYEEAERQKARVAGLEQRLQEAEQHAANEAARRQDLERQIEKQSALVELGRRAEETTEACKTTPAPVARPATEKPTRMLRCRDGSTSPSCECWGPRRGCCSYHGGVAGCE